MVVVVASDPRGRAVRVQLTYLPRGRAEADARLSHYATWKISADELLTHPATWNTELAGKDRFGGKLPL